MKGFIIIMNTIKKYLFNNIEYICIFFLLFLYFPDSFFGLSFYGKIRVLICLILISLCLLKYSENKIKSVVLKSIITSPELKLISLIEIPYIFIWLYTFLRTIFGLSIQNQFYKASTMLLSISCSLVLVLMILLVFKKKSIKVFLLSAVLNYSVVILKALYDIGITGILNFRELNETWVYRGLEVHELTFILGLFAVFCIIYMNKIKWFKYCIPILLLFVYLGYKRITFLAIAISLICIFLLNNNKIKTFVPWFIIITSFLYLISSAFGQQVFTMISDLFHINFMGRIDIYHYFSKQLSFGSFLFGHGFMFSESYMALSPVYKFYDALHNDIYRIFIDGGIIYFLFILYYLVFGIKKVIFKYIGTIDYKVYLVILIYTFIHFLTDNLIIYPRFIMIIVFLISYQVLYMNKKEVSSNNAK